MCCSGSRCNGAVVGENVVDLDVVDAVLRHCGGFQAVEGRSVSALKCQITVRRSKDTAAAGWSSDCLQHLIKAHKH